MGHKNIKSKRKRKKTSNNIVVPLLGNMYEMTYGSLAKKLQNEINSMKESLLFKGMIKYIKDIIFEQKCLFDKSFNSTDNNDRIKVNILCYGIGNFSQNKSALQQLALLHSLSQYFKDNNGNNGNNGDIESKDDGKQDNIGKISSFEFSFQKGREFGGYKIDNNVDNAQFILNNNIELYEPILNDVEIQVLKKLLNVNILSENTKGIYINDRLNDKNFNEITLCFMPHCPRSLYNNLIKSNFNPIKLSKLFIIGNSFNQYSELQTCVTNENKQSIQYIIACTSLKIIHEKPLDTWLFNNNDSNTNIINIKYRKRKKGKKKKRNKWQRNIKYDSFDYNDSSLKITQLEREYLAIAMNAFAFQSVQYFPFNEILRLNQDNIWDKYIAKLKKNDDNNDINQDIEMIG